MTYEELVAAGAKPADAPSGALTFEQLTAMGATPVVDAGPEARHATSIFGRPKMPEPKTDEELGIDEGPKFSREFPQLQRGGKTVFGLKGTIVPDAKSAPGTDAYRGAHSGDEMNDPGAQMLTGAALAAPATALVGGVIPGAAGTLLSGGVNGAQQAAFQGQDPVTGFALGAVPGVPGVARAASRAADRAIGEAAFNRATTKGFGAVGPDGKLIPGPVAKLLAKGVDTAIGGPVGLVLGGGKSAPFFTKAGNAATSALARRYLDQEIAGATVPDLVRLPTTEVAPLPGSVPGAPQATPRATGYSPSAPPLPSRAPLAPLTPAGPTLPTDVPPGALRTPFLDEISGEPVTQAGQGGFLPEEAPTNVGAKPSSLREDVMRDAQAYRRAPIEEESGEPPAPLESQLERSVRMLSELKSAARAGKVSPTMVQEALASGMSPQAVAKTVGREAFERATQ